MCNKVIYKTAGIMFIIYVIIDVDKLLSTAFYQMMITLLIHIRQIYYYKK